MAERKGSSTADSTLLNVKRRWLSFAADGESWDVWKLFLADEDGRGIRVRRSGGYVQAAGKPERLSAWLPW